MTAAEKLCDFQTSFQLENCDNSDSLLSGNVTATAVSDSLENSVDISSSMEEKIIPTSFIETDFPETNEKIQSTEIQNFTIEDSKNEKSADEIIDEWLDIMGSGDFKKKVCALNVSD